MRFTAAYLIDQDHHYVPVFYLKQWAESDGRVPYFQWLPQRIIQSRVTPKYTAYETNLYARDKVPVEERHNVEAFFQKLDTEAALIYRRLINLEKFDFSVDERLAWAMFLMAANLRMPDIVRLVKDDATQTLKEKLNENPAEVERILGHRPTMSLLEFTEKSRPGLVENFGLDMMLRHLTNEDRLKEVMGMEWSAHSVPASNNELLTCDRPLWYMENPTHKEFAMVLPLSPRVLFVASRNGKLNRAITHEREGLIAEKLNVSIISRALERVYGRARPAFVERVFRAQKAHRAAIAG